MPDDARVVAIPVQLKHLRDDAFDSLLAVDDAREVLQVLLGLTDRLRIVGSTDPLVARDDDLRIQGSDPVETADPSLAGLIVCLSIIM